MCGVTAGRRVDEVPDNVFNVPSRINSTWGGNLTVRSRRILEVIESEDLMTNAVERGADVLGALGNLADRHAVVSNPRGLCLMCAITLPNARIRNEVLQRLMDDERVLMLGCGERSLRVRPPLTVSTADIARAMAALDRTLTAVEG